MSTATTIEWTDKTWNPVRGCSRVSPGCQGCYAERQAIRHAGPGAPYEGLVRSTAAGPRWTGKVRLIADVIEDPSHWRKPQRIFVNSMSDLFHEALRFEDVADVFRVMAYPECDRHTFQVLTKRPQRMLDFFAWARRLEPQAPWPDHGGLLLPNVWLGVSVEDQQRADERLPLLLQAPAALRFLSVEPLLGPVDLSAWMGHGCAAEGDQDPERKGTGESRAPGLRYVGHRACEDGQGEAPRAGEGERSSAATRRDDGAHETLQQNLGPRTPGNTALRVAAGSRAPQGQLGRAGHAAHAPSIDWVIVGGESGPDSRPCSVEWVRAVVAQCREARVPVFVKQLGRTFRADRFDSVPAVARGGGWRSESPGSEHGIVQPLDRKGGEPAEWPSDLRVREFPRITREV